MLILKGNAVDNAIAEVVTRHQFMSVFRANAEVPFNSNNAREIWLTILEDKFAINAALLRNLLIDYDVSGIEIAGENKDYIAPYPEEGDEDQLSTMEYDALSENTSGQLIMAFLRADYDVGRAKLTELDRLWIFNTVLFGSSDLSANRLRHLLEIYEIEGIEIVGDASHPILI